MSQFYGQNRGRG